jgi:serine/threonine protein kinase
LGVLSFVILAGIFPFKGATDEELYSKINKADYPKSDLLFGKARDLIDRMLTIDP